MTVRISLPATEPKRETKADIDVMLAIALSGERGVTRAEIVERTKRHERNVRRSVKKLMKAGLIFIDSTTDNPNQCGAPREVLRAYMEGVDWLNARTDVYKKMNRA